MVVVESPAGTTSTLLGFRPADQIYGGFSLFNKWPMMSVHFWGENPVGNWTLTVVNRSPDAEDNAELFDWTLKFYGTREDPQPGTGVLDHRQVDKNGRKLPEEESEGAVEAEVPLHDDVRREMDDDVSEARGLEALEAHTKLTKTAVDWVHPDLLADVDITNSGEPEESSTQEPSTAKAESSEETTSSTTGASSTTQESSTEESSQTESSTEGSSQTSLESEDSVTTEDEEKPQSISASGEQSQEKEVATK